ncbi:P-loop containing nucleoside triphosphate hydrolase protein [Rhizoclosmatium globosum]|uniref:p-loop containing nucleoside triphosphate hydrolase protein n=1 Tax=Rhizoclosmatium globosum TaxID=329046 RepID=A0A1Y2B3T3_9FUNG|nr:P-loop containing nucleoside triphosphate hydrolase protein [Rhizoclosmatium globosum]|eukprot:ORY29492.1 P-loop containing nucleoside triphosphate hydrolase protein [Rhizoclosmatium globosum]
MGPSGAGKSTFLDVIAGRKGNAGVLHGQVLLNGTERPMKKYSSYVTQDDSLIGCFTVRETIRYAVEMGQPTTSKKVRDEKVHELLTQFGLMKCADSPVGDLIISGISGGEKRRLSIAVQLVKEPKIIFLDEPTTGLDSAASFRVMESIRDMARRRNCTVVCSIHQPSPSTYALFDQVLFLARGNTVYYGPNKGPEAAYFKTVGLEIPVHSNIPDVVLDNINVDFLGDESLANSHIDHLSKAWSNSNGRVESISAFESSLKLVNKAGDGQGMIVGGGDYIHSFGKQIEILTRRNLHNALKNILLFWARIGLYASMSVLMELGMPTNQNTVQDRFSAIFFAIAFLAFIVGAYVIANTLVSLPFIFIIAVSFATPAYWMMGLNAGASNFFIFITYLWLALYVAESFVVLISAMFPIFVAALTLVSFFNGLEMVLKGSLSAVIIFQPSGSTFFITGTTKSGRGRH